MSLCNHTPHAVGARIPLSAIVDALDAVVGVSTPGNEEMNAGLAALNLLRGMAEREAKRAWLDDFKAQAVTLAEAGNTGALTARCTAESMAVCADAITEGEAFALPYELALAYACKLSPDPERGGEHRSVIIEALARSYAAACVDSEGIQAPAADCSRDTLRQALHSLGLYLEAQGAKA